MPLLVGVGLRDARVFVDPRHGHLVMKINLAGIDRAADGRGGRGVGRRGQRNMTLAGEEPGGRIETNPSGAGKIDLRPRMEIGEVGRRSFGALQRFHVGLELDQIAGDEARGQAEMAQDLDQQPGAVAAGSAGQRERFLRRLDAGLETNQVADLACDTLIETDQEVVGALFGAIDTLEERPQARARGPAFEVRRQLLFDRGFVTEGEPFRIRLKEIVERIDDLHLGDEIDLDREAARLIRKDQPRQIIAVRVLLPVDEVFARLDLQRVGSNRGAAMRRGPQTNDLRREAHPAVVAIDCLVMQRDSNRHDRLSQ